MTLPPKERAELRYSLRAGAGKDRGLPGESALVVMIASVVSLVSTAHYYRWGQILLSGDAVAHINIARRVFDSRTPGPLQLGTVWLPLQHILTIPFIISDWGWSSGLGGAIPSMLSYVLGALGIYRLVREGLAHSGAELGMGRVVAWLAAAVFVANPNLIYLQATALNEAMSLALLVWATVFFSEFARAALGREEERAARALIRCGWLLAADMLVRYDGWFAGAAFVAAAVTVLLIAAHRQGGWKHALAAAGLRRALRNFILINLFAPVLWLGYNGLVWGNPLEFANGPYSAKAIEERRLRPGESHHPGWHSASVAAEYFVRDATLVVGEGNTAPRSRPGIWEVIWLVTTAAGVVLVAVAARELLPWLLLGLPVPFYTLSISRGSVPIFIPQWFPFSYYNARYGLQLLPALAVCLAVATFFSMRAGRARWWRTAVALAAFSFVAASDASVWRNVPLCLREIRANGGARYALDRQLGLALRNLPASATLLMYSGEHTGALQLAGIPLRRTINEGNSEAMQAPARSADFVIAAEGDPVAKAVAAHPAGLRLLGIIGSTGQSPVRIYASER